MGSLVDAGYKIRLAIRSRGGGEGFWLNYHRLAGAQFLGRLAEW